jgi:UDP-N-acetylmuramoyl-tripeptide--D-alanyl-D-alanine ligase
MAGLEPGGIAMLPTDTPLFPRLRAAAEAAGVRVVRFGTDAAADVRLVDIAMDADGSDVVADIANQSVQFRINAPGRHMAMNALAALSALAALATLETPKSLAAPEALENLSRYAGEVFATFSPIAGRGARRHIPVPNGTALLLDESYNGNGASMRAALSVLNLQPARRRIAVLGDMLELGDAGPSEHAALAPEVTTTADLVFACGPLMRHLFDAIPASKRGAHAPDSATLAPLVAHAIEPGDAILVKGSLGSRMRQVVDALDAAAAQHGSEAA